MHKISPKEAGTIQPDADAEEIRSQEEDNKVAEVDCGRRIQPTKDEGADDE